MRTLSQDDIFRLYRLSRHYLENESERAGAAWFLGQLKAESDQPDNAPALLAERDRARAEAAELRRLLRFLADAADTEPGMRIYREHIKQARAALARTEPEGGRA